MARSPGGRPRCGSRRFRGGGKLRVAVRSCCSSSRCEGEASWLRMRRRWRAIGIWAAATMLALGVDRCQGSSGAARDGMSTGWRYDPRSLFSILNPIALAGWLLLVFLPRWPSWTATVVRWGGAVPLLCAGVHDVLVAAALPGSEGGFSSLAGVRALFADPWVLLAGWTHYLAFDLFIGSWEVRDAQRRGVTAPAGRARIGDDVPARAGGLSALPRVSGRPNVDGGDGGHGTSFNSETRSNGDESGIRGLLSADDGPAIGRAVRSADTPGSQVTQSAHRDLWSRGISRSPAARARRHRRTHLVASSPCLRFSELKLVPCPPSPPSRSACSKRGAHMSKPLLAAVLLMSVVLPLGGAELSETDRRRLGSHLEMTSSWLIDEVSNLSRPSSSSGLRPGPGPSSKSSTISLSSARLLGRPAEGCEDPTRGPHAVEPGHRILWYGIDRTNRETAIDDGDSPKGS